MANSQRESDNVVNNYRTYIQNSICLQNAISSKPMQVSLNISNTINMNLARQIIPSNHHNPTRIEMNLKTDKNNVQQLDENDANDCSQNDTDQSSDEDTSDEEYLTPSATNGSQYDQTDSAQPTNK